MLGASGNWRRVERTAVAGEKGDATGGDAALGPCAPVSSLLPSSSHRLQFLPAERTHSLERPDPVPIKLEAASSVLLPVRRAMLRARRRRAERGASFGAMPVVG
jgi:hypothetical protein